MNTASSLYRAALTETQYNANRGLDPKRAGGAFTSACIYPRGD